MRISFSTCIPRKIHQVDVNLLKSKTVFSITSSNLVKLRLGTDETYGDLYGI